MNQAQRKFLIERIQSKSAKKIEILRKSLWDYPSRSSYVFQAIMNNTLVLKSQEDILAGIKKKALSAKEGANWLSDDRMGWEKERTIRLPTKDIFELPKALYDRVEEVKNHNSSIHNEMEDIKLKMESIEVRIQLASDKTLRNLINEVDDMGDLRLIDTTVKRLN